VLTPASRLLQFLDLLQSQPLATGREIAERLAIDRRTVRRYVAKLQELGIPVEGERGVGGGYRLRPGYRLPPLMLTDDEATAVTFGLLVAERQGLGSADAALAKIRRVLPQTLRRRVEALETGLGLIAPAAAGVQVDGRDVLLLAEAIRRRLRVRAHYRSFEGVETDRELSPHGLVAHSGCWYLAAYDHLRRDLRTFRVDRMARIAAGEERAVAAPDGFDPVAYVSSSLAQVPLPWKVEIVLDLPVDEVARRLPRTLAELRDEGSRTRVHMRVTSLDWTAALLSGLACDFTIVQPAELRASVRKLATRLERVAAG
jgi:predicted DNA-binding transcriptional regulator YafY